MTSLFCSRAIKRALNVCEFRFVDFEQVGMMERSGHGIGIDVGRPQVDVAKASGAPVSMREKPLNLTAGGIGSLQQGAEINHVCTIRTRHVGDIQIQMVVGDIRADIKMRNAPLDPDPREPFPWNAGNPSGRPRG